MKAFDGWRKMGCATKGIATSALKGIGVMRPSSTKKIPKLVIAINCVDLIEPGNWDVNLNLPSPEQEINIEKKCSALASRLSRTTGIPKNQIAYYSALQYFRLENLLSAMILATPDGFIWGSYKPKSFEEKIDPSVKERVMAIRRKEHPEFDLSIMDRILLTLKKELPKDKYDELISVTNKRLARPPKVALLGQTGVGKTTTICSLVGIDPLQAKKDGIVISHVGQGTREAATYDLKTNNGTITLVDMPGYGVSSEDDARYYEMYKQIIPNCDVVLLVVQATNRAIAQDELMIKNVKKWLSVSR